ncbi:uncharacterized protein LOC142588761 [Dermacentor variabilis]|uniref:uncharacterized protein LOC142588761 n=1 Tax=Dermacentor variabilis TaxID=34621 RepID=UPI003F5B68B6
MSSHKSKKSRRSANTDNRHRRRNSYKASMEMPKSSTDAPPPEATTTALAETGGATTCDPGNGFKVDATRKATDDYPEAGTAAAGVQHRENSAGNILGLRSTDVNLARPQSSTEKNVPGVEPTPPQPQPTTVAGHASASHNLRSWNAVGGVPNAKDFEHNGSQSTDFRLRERLILHGPATTIPVGQTVSPPKEERLEGNTGNRQELAPLPPQSAIAPLSTLSPDPQAVVAAEGAYASPEVFGSVTASGVNTVLNGPRGKSRGPLPASSSVTGQQPETQERNPDGGTVTEVPPAHRTGFMAAASTIRVSTTARESSPKDLNTAHSTIQAASPPMSQRSLAPSALSLNLEASFYEKMAVIRRTPPTVTAKSSTIDRWAAFGLAFLFVSLILSLTMILIHWKIVAKICDTQDCLAHASLLKASLNLSVDPCHDFSAFVCSRWAQKQTAFREDANSVMDGLRYSWYKNFGETLRLGSLKLPVGKKPLAMYEMCLSDSSSAGKASHIPLMLSLFLYLPAAWRDISNEAISAVSLAILFAYKWQAPFWLTVTVLDGSRLSSGRRRAVVKPGAYLPSFLRQHRAATDSYGQYMLSFFNAYLPRTDDRPIHLTDSHVSSVRDMEADVLGQLNAVYSQRKPSVLTFAELDAMIAIGSAVSDSWLRSFREALSLEPQPMPQDEVLVSHAVLFEIIAGLVARYGDAKLRYLLIWEFVQLYVPLGDLSLLATRYGSTSKENI